MLAIADRRRRTLHPGEGRRGAGRTHRGMDDPDRMTQETIQASMAQPIRNRIAAVDMEQNNG